MSAKKPTQMGISSEFEKQGNKDYNETLHFKLNQSVWRAISDQGSKGATAKEINVMIGHDSVDSIATRCNELRLEEKVRRTDARRDGQIVYVALEKAPK